MNNYKPINNSTNAIGLITLDLCPSNQKHFVRYVP